MEAQPNSRYAALATLVKAGNIVSPSAATSVRSGQMANAEMWKWIMSAAGLGMLGRGAVGLGRLAKPSTDFRPSPSYQPVDVVLPEEEEEEKFAHDKEAGGPVGAAYDKLTDMTSGLPWGKNWFFGKGSTSPMTVPALWTLGMPGAMLAGYGGWSGVDKLLDSRRQSELEGEQTQVKKQYEQLLRETMAKHGDDAAGLEADLDELADMAFDGPEKTAELTDWRNTGASMALSYAVLSALASGKLSYDYFKKRNQRTVAEEALKRRAKERTGGVSPIYLQPATGAA